MKASLELVSMCSGIKEVYLEAQYRRMCNNDDTPATVDYEVPPEEMEESGELPGGPPESCQDVLLQLQQESALAKALTDYELGEEIEEGEKQETTPDDVSGMPCGDLVEHLLRLANAAEAFGSEQAKSPKQTRYDNPDHLPSTLREALLLPGDKWNALFRHIIRLRNAKGGMDTLFLKNAKSCRRAAKGLNWYQLLVRIHYIL